ncbi:MAG: rod shape-determining protein MreD [Chloroflexi bacterium]|nr:hypothetical protein [Anaerolineae bacterium]MCC6567380.1 rod shape-determining protein MreD [Chloroflexota bacterium]MCO6445136.1 rod shape-determining protein MreD [Anaerolineae bacterium]MDL1914475.1 rod shape-determining protein MreD [Anaerolineae bacterium CFX4]RIK21640.1 MAG: rod shape-determining protein MreD [Chloroflexota bacterium]
MGGFLAIPILGLAAILQASLVPILDLPGGGPNLTFVIVLAWALNAPVGQAALWALLGGLFADLLSIVPLGTSSLGLLLMVAALNALGSQVFQLRFLLLLVMSVFGTMAYEFLRVVLIDLYQLLGYVPATASVRIDWASDLTTTVFPTIVYNFILILPVYIILRLFQRRLPRPE